MKKSTSVWIGWVLVGLLIAVLIGFSVGRSIYTYSGAPPQSNFDARYIEHPLIAGLHMYAGILFLILAPLQFSKKLRANHISMHRILGRILMVCALISGLYGIAALVALPAFGGLATETSGWFFGCIFLFSIARAFWCIKNKKIASHREWMIRAFALGLGVGTQRLVLAILMMTTSYGFEQNFGPALWLGFAINMIIAEFWINITRSQTRSSK